MLYNYCATVIRLLYTIMYFGYLEPSWIILKSSRRLLKDYLDYLIWFQLLRDRNCFQLFRQFWWQNNFFTVKILALPLPKKHILEFMSTFINVSGFMTIQRIYGIVTYSDKNPFYVIPSQTLSICLYCFSLNDSTACVTAYVCQLARINDDE